MSVSFPANLIYVKHHDDQHKNVLLIENKPEIVKLTDGRKVHILIENPATKKPEPDRRLPFFTLHKTELRKRQNN